LLKRRHNGEQANKGNINFTRKTSDLKKCYDDVILSNEGNGVNFDKILMNENEIIINDLLIYEDCNPNHKVEEYLNDNETPNDNHDYIMERNGIIDDV